MSSQKVPGMSVLRCNDRTYDNTYLITFKVGPLHTHMHLLHWSCHCQKHRGRRIHLESSGVRPSHSIWCPPWLRNLSHFQSTEQPKFIFLWGIAAHEETCGSVHYRDAETTVRLPLVVPLPPNCIARSLQNSHVKIISNTLRRWYELIVSM
jgi:hypothetical protein